MANNIAQQTTDEQIEQMQKVLNYLVEKQIN